MSPESQSYQTMYQEVETLVKDLGNADLDLDLLVQKVERGYELLKSMKTRLEETKNKIEALHLKYEDSTPS